MSVRSRVADPAAAVRTRTVAAAAGAVVPAGEDIRAGREPPAAARQNTEVERFPGRRSSSYRSADFLERS